MSNVSVKPGNPNATHDISLFDGKDTWGIRLDGGFDAVQQLPSDTSTVVFSNAGSKYGDGETGMSHIEQRDWSGGRGQEDFVDDNSRYFDAQNMWTLQPGKVFPSLQWKIADGVRIGNSHLPGNMKWQSLISATRYLSNTFTAGSAYAADKAYMWIRRRGSPGTLTFKLHSDTAGDPGAVLQTVTKTISDVEDVVSLFQVFDWTGTESLTDTNVYHVSIYGAAGDSSTNHWEIGVDDSGSAAQYSSDGTTWTAADYTLYYRVVTADDAQKWHMFILEDVLFAVSQPDSGSSVLMEWDESTDTWSEVTIDNGDALSGTVKSVAISGKLAHMARGTANTIWTLQVDGTDRNGQTDTTAGNTADVIHAFYDPVDGPQIWRGENDNDYVSRASTAAFNTDLEFGDDIELEEDVLNIADYNDQIWVRTTSKLYSIKNDRASKLNVGLEVVPEPDDYSPMIAKDYYLYVGWSFSVERLYGGTLDDMGVWRGAGMPDNRKGAPAELTGYIGNIIMGQDGGTSNYSSVLFHNGMGWHEVFRAWEAGQRVRNVFIQPQSTTSNPRLWISIGTDLVYMELPKNEINPLEDSNTNYMHEGVLITSTFDMGATRMKKYFKEMTAITDNLASNITIDMDYQLDEDVGTSTWTEASTFYQSDEDSVYIQRGSKKRCRIRFRFQTNDASTPAVMIASVLELYGRKPFKRQWNIRLRSGGYQVTWLGTPDHDPNDLVDWLMDAAVYTRGIHMRSIWEQMDDIYVTVEPASVFPSYTGRQNDTDWRGRIMLTLREL